MITERQVSVTSHKAATFELFSSEETALVNLCYHVHKTHQCPVYGVLTAHMKEALPSSQSCISIRKALRQVGNFLAAAVASIVTHRAVISAVNAVKSDRYPPRASSSFTLRLSSQVLSCKCDCFVPDEHRQRSGLCTLTTSKTS